VWIQILYSAFRNLTLLFISYLAFMRMLGRLACLGFLLHNTHMWAPSLVLEPPFKAGVGSLLHGSLAIPIFSAKHALAKEKGFRNPMPTFLLVYSQYSHHLVLIAISPFRGGQTFHVSPPLCGVCIHILLYMHATSPVIYRVRISS